MISPDVKIGDGTVIYHKEMVNIYGCEIGNNCKIATFVSIERGAKVGDNCKIQSFVFIPGGVTVGNGVFIGPHVCFTNDKHPAAVDENGNLLGADQWVLTPTVVEDGASIGANSTIVCGVKIGKGAKIGAGSVVTKDVPDFATVYGNPARIKG